MDNFVIKLKNGGVLCLSTNETSPLILSFDEHVVHKKKEKKLKYIKLDICAELCSIFKKVVIIITNKNCNHQYPSILKVYANCISINFDLE